MKKTIKEKALVIRDFIVLRGKLVFPILLIAAVAVTVTIALRAGSDKVEAADETETVPQNTPVAALETSILEVPDVPLEVNAYPEVNELILAYFNAMAEGDVDTIVSIQSSTGDMERIKIVEMGKYIESYPAIEVYTKPGPEEGSYIVIAYTKVIMSYYPEDCFPGYASFYVCTGDDGSLYINKESVDEEISEYIRKVILQDDVVELCNKVEVEYKDFCSANPEYLKYIAEVEREVKMAAGVTLAEQESNGGSESVDAGTESVNATGNDEVPPAPDTETKPVDAGPVMATATTTVNVRSSDSEKADKLGKLAGGEKVEVLEQKANGWSKIVFERKEGYVRSDYLNLVESASGVETIGTVTATTNVNVRAAASQTADKLGIVSGGDELKLVANEGDWCKIIYNGQIGYIKAEFLQ